MKKKLNVAIAGATGAVGAEFIKVLAKRNFPIARLKLLASANSRDKELFFKEQPIKVEVLTSESFKDIDIAFFSAGAQISLKYAPEAVKLGALVVDNSSAFRMDKHVPLVVPECNRQEIFLNTGIIANPNCSTIQMVVALNPLHNFSSLTDIKVATYQAVSGSGTKAILELENQIQAYANKQPLIHEIYPAPILGNLIPQVDTFIDDQNTKEELKMVNETKKILNEFDINIDSICVRAPVFRAHSEAIWASTKQKISKQKALQLWKDSPGIKVIDETGKYPTPATASGTDFIYIGRIKESSSAFNTLGFWCVSDQLLKGAALNAVQIAEHYFKITN